MSQAMSPRSGAASSALAARSGRRLLAVMALIVGQLSLGGLQAPWAAAAVPDPGIGSADYTSVDTDCVVPPSGLGGPDEPGPGCDEYAADLMERPTAQDPDPAVAGDYHGWIDISETFAGFDGAYLYLAIDLVAEKPAAGLSGSYGFEIDTDADGAGDFLVALDDGSVIGTSWEQTGLTLLADVDGSVGGADPFAAEGSGSQNGYEIVDWSVGDSPSDVLWARISPSDPTVVELAVAADRIGSPASAATRGWAAAGALPIAIMQLHDEYTEAQYGSPYAASPYYPPPLFDIDVSSAAGGTSTTLRGVSASGAQASGVCPSSTADYDVTFSNTSIGAADLFDLSAISSQGWRVDLYDATGVTLVATDLTGDGSWDFVDPVYDADSDGDPDTGSLAAGSGKQVQVSITAPAAGVGTADVTTLTATSDADGAVFAAAGVTSTVADCENPSVAVSDTPAPSAVDEPGGTVTFTIGFDNTTLVAVDIDSLTDTAFGNLLDPGNASVASNTCPALAAAPLAAEATASCSFDGEVVGDFGDADHTSTVTALLSISGGSNATEQASAAVSFTDAIPAITLDVAPGATSIAEPGDDVTFAVSIENLGYEEIALDTLDDDVFGDLLDAGNTAVSANTCAGLAGTIIAGGATLECGFSAEILGAVGDPDHENTTTASASDDEGNPAADQAAVVLPFVPGTADVTGVVFEDVNGDTLHTGLEPGIEGVEIAIADGAGLAIVRTGADGVWSLTVESGNVDIAVVPSSVPDGFALTTGNDTQAFEAVADALTEAADIGYQAGAATIGGMVFEDTDADGVKDDGELGVPGVDVAVTDTEGASVVTTGPDGSWSTGVAVGAVEIAVDEATVPYGWSLTTGNAVQDFDLEAGDDVAAGDIGYQPRQASVSGVAFFDGDGDGVWDADEPPMPGIAFTVSDGAEVDRVVVADDDGVFTATDLPGGDYTVVVDPATVPDGFTQGSGSQRSDRSATAVTVVAGEDVALDLDFTGTGSISDVVWVDDDADGVPDDDEDRLPGAQVSATWAGLDDEFGTSDDYTFPVAISDAEGAFRFEDVPPGEFRVRIDITSVSEDYTLVTLTEVGILVAPGEDAVSGGFAFANADEALAYTGLSASGLMILAAALVAAGFLLLFAGGRIHERYLRARARITGIG